jgi:hypothetical protein
LVELGDARAAQLFEHVTGLADSADAWAEYYEQDQPQGTRCRPWESGMSIAAVVRYIDR